MSYYPCHHKSTNDFSRVIRADGRRTWRCSVCGSEFLWDERSTYYGSIECSKCQAPEIAAVACSDGCAAALKRMGAECR